MVRGTSWAGMDESRSPVNRKICNIALDNYVYLIPHYSFHTSFALDPHLCPPCTFGGLVYHPIPHIKVPSMGGCLPKLPIMGFSVYHRIANYIPPVVWYQRGTGYPPQSSDASRRVCADCRKLVRLMATNTDDKFYA